MAIALVLILIRSEVVKGGGTHRAIGWMVVGLAAAQFLSAWLRGTKGGPTAPAPDGSWSGDHYDMTPRRILFERFHKTTGYLLILLATAAILRGLWVANAPAWMWIALAAWWECAYPRLRLAAAKRLCGRYLSGDLGTGFAASRQRHEAHRVGGPSALDGRSATAPWVTAACRWKTSAARWRWRATCSWSAPVDQDETGATIWMKAMRRGRTVGRA